MKKRKNILLFIISIIILVGIILFGFLNNNLEIINLKKEKENLALSKISGRYVRMVEEMGDGESVDGEIRIYSEGTPPDVIADRTYDFTNGYCMHQGDTFKGYVPKGDNVKYESQYSGYEKYGGSIRWLFDNVVLFPSPADIDEYKSRLAYILNYDTIKKMENNEIFSAQQYAVWHFTNEAKTDELIPEGNIGELANKLIKKAEKNSNYSGNGASTTITDKSDKKLEKIGNDFWIGPYNVNNNGKIYKLTIDNTTINGKIVKIELYTGKNSGSKIDNDSYRTQSGDIYIKIPGSLNNNFSGILSQKNNFSASIDLDDYATSTRYWECESKGYQPAVTIQREHKPINISSTGIYNAPDGEYHMNIVKKAIWDTNTDSESDTADKYKNAIGDAKFEITQSGKNFAQTNNGKTKDKDELVSISGNIGRIVFNNNGSYGDGRISITEDNWSNEDYYSIKEIAAPEGYSKNNRELYFGVTKIYDSESKKYVINQIICYKDSNYKDVITSVSPEKDVSKWIKIGFNGELLSESENNYAIALEFRKNAITITYKDYPESSYNLNIAKRSTDSTIDSANEYKDCLEGAIFEIKQNRNDGSGIHNGFSINPTAENKNNESAFDHDSDGNRIVKTWKGTLAKLAFDGHGSDSDGNVKVDGDNYNKEDIYTVKEIKSPNGYTNEGRELKFGILKKLSDDKKSYVIDKVKFYGLNVSSNTVIKEVTSNGNRQWLKIDKNGNVVDENSDNYVISLDFNQTAINVIYKDPEIKGNYDFKLAKLDSADISKITSLDEYEKLKYVSGVEYGVSQLRASVVSPVIGDNRKITTQESPVSIQKDGTIIGKDVINNIIHNGSSDYDNYLIYETNSKDAGYVKKDVSFNIGVCVTIENNNTENAKYVVNKIKCYKNKSNTGDPDCEINQGEKYVVLNTGKFVKLEDILKLDKKQREDKLFTATAIIGLDNSSTISYVGINQQITGNYKLRLKKIYKTDDGSEIGVKGISFKVNKKINGENGTGTNFNLGPTGNNGYTNIYTSNITKDDVNKTDVYEISEIEDSNENLIQLKNPIKIFVTKKCQKSQGNNDLEEYVIDKASFEYGDEVTEGETSETVATLEDGTEVSVKMTVSSSGVLITVPNKLNGHYNLNIGKKSTENNEYKNNNDSDYIAGAKFNVEQYLNVSQNISDINNINPNKSDSIVSQSGKSVPVTFNKNANIDIDSTALVDRYKITEMEAPKGFSLNKSFKDTGTKDGIYLTVTKTMQDGVYKIKNLSLTRIQNGNSYVIKDGITDDIITVDDYNCKIVWNKDTNTIDFIIGDPVANGEYDFKITKTDVTGEIIDSEITTFDVDVYSQKNESNGKVSFSNPVSLKHTDGTNVELKNIKATTGVTTNLNNIKIDTNDIGKTYYFVITETQAPDAYSMIDYKVVVPVKYVEQDGKYYISKDESFAVTADNTKQSLEKMSSNVNEVVKVEPDEELGNTINVKVPNKIKKGTYTFKFSKVNPDRKIIGSTKTRFNLNVYAKMTENSNKVSFSDLRKLYDVNNKEIITTDLKCTMGVCGTVSNIKIEEESIGKTYYFVLEENEAPEGFNKIEYKVVVPITYKQNEDGYFIEHGELFAVTADGTKKAIKDIDEIERAEDYSNANKPSIVFVKVPNTPKEGSYSLNIVKTNLNGNTNSKLNATFDVNVYKTKNINGNKVEFSNEYKPLKDTADNNIKTTDLVTENENTINISGIKIQKADAGKEYYFIINEKVAPTGYNGIDYKIVVPISFIEKTVDGKTVYTAKVGEAFGLKNSSGDTTVSGDMINLDDRVSIPKTTDGIISVTVKNNQKNGGFKLNLVKYIKGSTATLPGAKFKVTIKDNGTGKNIYSKSDLTTDGEGKIPEITGLDIRKENVSYTVTVEETYTPDGYLGLSGPIKFTVKSRFNTNKDGYELVAANPTVANAKKVEVKSGEIYIEAENIPEPSIHKGVKTVENQDSGYYDNVEHDWVINTTVPTGINQFTKYYVTDKIDERLVFSRNSVTVKVIGGNKLTAGKDYKANYDSNTRVLTVSFINDDFVAGKSLPENSTIEIRFKTTFAKDENGNIKALGQAVPNQAELTYSNDSEEHKKYSETPEVHTGGIKLYKFEDENGNGQFDNGELSLAGARFKIALTEQDALNKNFIKIKDKNGNNTANDIVGESNSEGIVEFKGLEFGGDASSNVQNRTTDKTTHALVYNYDETKVSSDFWIVETSAPEGYIIDETPIRVTITKDSYNTEIAYMPKKANISIKGEYSVKLRKVNNQNNNIQNAEFKILSSISKATRSSVKTDANGIIDVSNGKVNIIANDKSEDENSSTVGKADSYEIKELSASSYLILKNSIKIIVNKELNEAGDKYRVSSVELSETGRKNSTTLIVSDTSKTATLKGVLLADNKKTVDVKLSIDGSDNILVNVPNDDLEGEYNISLLKKNSNTGEILKGIPFNINGTARATDENGTLSITQDREVDGSVKITRSNVGTPDQYVIKEETNEKTKYVSIIESPITVKVNKGENKNKNQYIVKSLEITATSTSGEKTTTITINESTNTGSGTFLAKCTDGTDVKCTVRAGSSGITIELDNPSKAGSYNFDINKVVLNDNDEEQGLEGVSFNVNLNGYEYPLSTNANGYTENITKDITSDNVDNNDEFVISELSTTQTNIVQLKNNLKLIVTKGVNSSNNGYEVKTMELAEVDANNPQNVIRTTGVINIDDCLNDTEKRGTLYLENVLLKDGRSVNIRLTAKGKTGFQIGIKNRTMTGNYVVKIRKVNSATGESIEGITFFTLQDKYEDSYEATTGSDGIAELINKKITNNEEEYYTILEKELPDNLKDKLLQITDYGLYLNIKTKKNDDNSGYLVDSVEMSSIKIQDCGDEELSNRQKEIMDKATYDVNDNVITITIYNEPLIDYNFRIYKVNNKNEELTEAKFTIKEDGVTILENQKLSEINGLISRAKQKINTVHTYDFYETEAPLGYDNIFEKTYLRITIKIDDKGKVTADYKVAPNREVGGTISDMLHTNAIIKEYKEASDNNEILHDNLDNSFTLHIPNPVATASIKFELNKHTLGTTDSIDGVGFDIRRLYIENEQSYNYTDITNMFDNDQNGIVGLKSITTSSQISNINIDNIKDINVGDTYYYELTENSGKFLAKYKKVIVRIHVNKDKTIVSNIIAVYGIKDGDNTNSWFTEINSDYASISQNNTNTILSLANTAGYAVIVNKKQFVSVVPKDSNGNILWTGMQGLSGATFTIKEVENDGTEKIVNNSSNEPINNKVCTGSFAWSRTDATTSKRYHYTIRENSSPDGYINIFDGVTIHVYITIKSDGTVDDSDTATYYELEFDSGISEEDKASKTEYLKDKIGINLQNNTINLNILNKKDPINLAVKKISDKKDSSGKSIPLNNIKFSIRDTFAQDVRDIITNVDGYAEDTKQISIPQDSIFSYYIEETEVPSGITMLKNTRIIVSVDATNLTSASQLTSDRLTVSLSKTGEGGLSDVSELPGLKVGIEGNTVVLTVPNETETYLFNMYKVDENNNIIKSETGKVGAKFKVDRLISVDDNGSESYFTLLNNVLKNGSLSESNIIDADKVYKYRISEISSKTGYINVLQGYDLFVYVKADSQGKNIKDLPETYYILSKKDGETQLYSEDEIRSYIDLSVADNVVNLYIKNPYAYKFEINKKNLAGTTDVDKAVITGDRIANVGEDLTNANKTLLKQIVDASEKNDSTGDSEKYIAQTIKLDKKTSIISGNIEIKENVTQTWRITENSVELPYVNILKDKYLIVQTLYSKNNGLKLVSHQETINNENKSVNYYVSDKDGNNVTAELYEYLNVKTVQVNGIWTLSVTVKDPVMYEVDLTKVEYNPNGKTESDYKQMKGAELSLTNSNNGESAEITKNGEAKTRALSVETSLGDLSKRTFEIRELSTIVNHKNILENVVVYVTTSLTEDGTLNYSVILKDNTGKTITGTEETNILEYIKFFEGTNADGYKVLHVYVENPVEYDFKLEKLDTSKKPLSGTQIEVNSSKSGKYYTNGKSEMSFKEQNLKPGDIITYTIREVHTVANSAYVNRFYNTITYKVEVKADGTLEQKEAYITTSDGNKNLSEVRFLDYGISGTSGNQTIYFKLENPTKINVELLKTQAGKDESAILNTNFTINSSLSGDHTENTDSNGLINFTESSIKPGDYTYKVYENKVANPNYVNVLDGMYMEVNVSVSAAGLITINSTKYYYKENNVEITNESLLTKLRKYATATVDDSASVKKLKFVVKDPVTFEFKVFKHTTGNEKLENVKFKITSPLSGEQTATTDSNGYITVDSDKWVEPGVYKYEITELETIGKQYDNILDGYKVVVYLKISNTGLISLVKDANGTAFTKNDKYKYSIEKIDGSDVSSEASDIIHKYITVTPTEVKDAKDKVTVSVANTTGYNMDIIKKDSAGNKVSGSKFTVIRNKTVKLLDNEDVTSDKEITERDLSQGNYTFDITENSAPEGAYINILDGKFIRAYTYLSDKGVLDIRNSSGTVSNNYFEIYEGDITNTSKAKLLDKNDANYKYLYNLISVNAQDKDKDGIYTIDVSVINPVNINVEVLKKQYGTGGKGIAKTEFTISRDENNKHENVFTNNSGIYDFTEERIAPGDYTYTVKELSPASGKYVNILKDRYMEVYINVNAKGEITVKGYELFSKEGTKLSSEIKNEISKYIAISVNKSSETQKLVITIYNPTTMTFDLYKSDIDNKPLANAKFKISRTLVKVYANNKTTKDIKELETTTDKLGKALLNNDKILDPGIYKYEITELNAPGNQYVNTLENIKVVIYVKLALNGNVSIVANNSGTEFKSDTVYKYYVLNSDNSVASKEVQDLVHKYFTVTTEQQNNSIGGIKCDVINPIRYKVDIIKNDERAKPLSGTKFSVVRDDGIKVLDNAEITTDVEIEENYIEQGDHVYYITENSTVPGYINKLKGMFIKAYINVSAQGVVTVNKYEIYKGTVEDISKSVLLDKNKNLELYNLIGVESVVNDNVYTLNVKVTNPDLTYNLLINKKIFGNEEINLANTKFTVIRINESNSEKKTYTNKVTDKNGNISILQERIPAGIYKYLITETRTSGNQFVNIFANSTYVVVRLKVNEDGTIKILDENGNVSEDAYDVYRQKANTSVLEKIDSKDTVINKSVVRVGITTNNNNVPELDIFVKNPEKYNFNLIKIDSSTKEKLNNVKFSLTVYEGKNVVKLKDANTFKEINTNELVTKNVNGKDGYISIKNILIEKSGKYTFVLHEESTDGLFEKLYKTHGSDIKVTVEIVVQNGEYIIKKPVITQGSKYVDALNVTSTKSQTASVEVINTPITGSYELVIDKLDSYTEKNLKGAEFDISVEKDGKPYELYKANKDLTVNEKILPKSVKVNGELTISDIRIDRPETYTIILKETKAPTGYMLLDAPIKIKVTTGRSGSYDDEKFIVESIELIDDNNHGLVTADNGDESIHITAKNEYFDLALRKSITSVAYSDREEAKITEEETKDRVPIVESKNLIENDKVTTADYNHVKNHVRGYNSQEVIFTLRVYNEGEIDGYAEEITDHLPEGLEFVNDSFNAEYGWKLDSSDTSLRTIKTTYLSKDSNPNNDKYNSKNNLIKAMDKTTGKIDFKEIQVKCKISEDVKVGTILTNIAEISKSKANNRTAETVDIDSTTNNVKVPETSEGMEQYNEDKLTDDRNKYVPGQEDDDDFEKIIVDEFDLALRKYITEINDEKVIEDNGDSIDEDSPARYAREPIVNVDSLKDGTSTTAEYDHPKDPVEVSVGDIVTYTLRVYNEGTVSGYASLIKDDIPEGLEFVTYDKGDRSTNDIYRWKMVNENDEEVTDPSEAKYVVSDYLSKDNEKTEFGNLIKAFDHDTMSTLDSKYVKIAFRVVCKQDYPKIITNEAQISDDSDESGKSVIDRDSTPNEWLDEDDEDIEHIKVTYMDLALRKFITGVNSEEVTNRVPVVDATALKDETGTTADYKHTKEPVLVHTNDTVIYTLRVYNEGSKDGYATQIKDDIPQGLEFLPNNEINKQYGWALVDENDKVVTNIENAKYIVTNYLSKDNETEERNNLLKAFDGTTMETPDYRDVKIAFKVIEPTTSDRIIINYAQISEQTDKKGVHREDRDSTPNKWLGEDDEDIEKIRVLYFDLALRKWVTKAIVVQNGRENVTETGHHAEDDPEAIVKVDLKKSKINSVVVKFEYKIRITNEGEIEGYAKEIKDHIPEGLRFEASDNPTWTQISDNIIVTDELKDTLLKPGESAEVTVVLTWINSGTNLGVKVNIAEISEDYNEYGTDDIDSTPDNFVDGEDDIDDAPVMLTVKTGQENLAYTMLALAVITVLGLGIRGIKKMK